MKVAVIGKGNVGTMLGNRFVGAGHEVFYGVREPQSDDTKSVHDAVAWADLIILAVPASAAEEATRALGDLQGKVLVDLTNPLKPTFDGLIDGVSSGERVAAAAQNGRVVKAFNTIGTAIMQDPRFGDRGATLLVAGDDADAKAQVSELAHSIGFEPVDVGGIVMSHYTEAIAWLWINQAVKQGLGHGFVFQLVTR